MPLFPNPLEVLQFAPVCFSITGSENDLEFGSQIIAINSDGNYNISGMIYSGQKDGYIMQIINDSDFTITLLNNSVLSAAENRIWRPNGTNYSIIPYASIRLIYREVVGRVGWWLATPA